MTAPESAKKTVMSAGLRAFGGVAGLVLGGIVALLLSLTVPVAAVHAQQGAPIRRVAFLSDAVNIGPLELQRLDAFREGLRAHGWVEGRNVTIEFREAKTLEQRPEMVAALLATKPEVLVTTAVGAFVVHPSPSRPFPGWTPVRDVPIVFIGQSDPVGVGLVQSLPKPGGSVTGLSYLGLELNGKRLEILKELIPTLARVGVLVPGNHPSRERMVKDVGTTARALGISLQLIEVANTDPVEKIDTGFEAMVRNRAQAVLGLQGPHYYRERKRVCELAARHNLPGAFEVADYTEAGCLMSYATNLRDLYRRSAYYVDRILRGAKPADLPVEQPTTFELIVNAKAAKALRMTLPPAFLLRADRVIE